jgi:FkbM family methyltransferase
MAWKKKLYPPSHNKKIKTEIVKPETKPLIDIIPSIQKRYVPMSHLSNYTDLLESRELDVEGTKGTDVFLEGEDQWTWIKADNGAWDGPHRDWYQHHSKLYFKNQKNFDVCVCAGANQGMYVRFLAKKFQTVYAFEPDPLNFHCLVMNNQLDNVVKMNCALGETNGFCFVERSGMENTGTFKVVAQTSDMPDLGLMRVPILSLDSMNFNTLNFLQLDAEGFEINILRGAKETIKRCNPVITAENGKTAQIVSLMKELNYIEAGQSVADTIWLPKP